VAFELYLIVAWVTGPNFEEVTPGPSVPPTWMQIAVRGGEIVATLISIVMLYRLAWRRGGGSWATGPIRRCPDS
jgi:hypothetical protein